MDLLQSFTPAGHETQYDIKVEQARPHERKLLRSSFNYETETQTHALLAYDGMNSFCRRLAQGNDGGPKYSEKLAFRCRIAG